MRNKLLEKLIEKRFQGPDAIQKILKSNNPSRNESAKRHRPSQADGSRYIRGVYRGNYYRVKIPEQRKIMRIPSFPPVAPPPNLNAMVADASHRPNPFTRFEQQQNEGSKGEGTWSRFADWAAANWATILLNFGSVCTLTAFTRSDVLELRCLSATGSLCNATYHACQSPFVWFSVLWPTIFASVNLWKIVNILEERTANVHLTEEQERIFVEYFMPHGITPKQFERLEAKAEILHIKKDGFIIRQGSPVESVYLVVQGSTTASILGRHLSAQSTSSRTRGDRRLGGDSGVWIGEMTFLDRYWEKEQKKIASKMSKAIDKSSETDVSNGSAERSDEGNKDVVNSINVKTRAPAEQAPLSINKATQALYTIVATNDCTVWRWSFEDLEALMSSSTDMRGSMTRAMTSAVVGKVLNMTISKAKTPTWTAWLTDWTRDDGAVVELKRIITLPEDEIEPTTAKQLEPSG